MWNVAAPAISSAFLASFVEVVEAFTIVLAVGTFQGWRSAFAGTGAALVVLAVLIAVFGSLLSLVHVDILQIVIGVLLLLFGMGWLRKAILRSAGILALHDEEKAFRKAASELASPHATFSWLGAVTAFKAVLLEGLEVIFIVIAVGAGRGLIWPASLGAAGALVAVLLLGLVIRKPLSRVPENALKLCVGTLLTAFGVFWTGEGLGIDWPGHDLILLVFIPVFLLTALALGAFLRRPAEAL
jgi:uncharacterized membrane protein